MPRCNRLRGSRASTLSPESNPVEPARCARADNSCTHRACRAAAHVGRTSPCRHHAGTCEPCCLDTHHNRGLDTRLVATLSHGQWINQAQTLLICGPTGVGKTWLACAFA